MANLGDIMSQAYLDSFKAAKKTQSDALARKQQDEYYGALTSKLRQESDEAKKKQELLAILQEQLAGVGADVSRAQEKKAGLKTVAEGKIADAQRLQSPVMESLQQAQARPPLEESAFKLAQTAPGTLGGGLSSLFSGLKNKAFGVPDPGVQQANLEEQQRGLLGARGGALRGATLDAGQAAQAYQAAPTPTSEGLSNELLNQYFRANEPVKFAEAQAKKELTTKDLLDISKSSLDIEKITEEIKQLKDKPGKEAADKLDENKMKLIKFVAGNADILTKKDVDDALALLGVTRKKNIFGR